MQRPDATIEEADARCSLWWSSTPAYIGKRVGFIGNYSRESQSSARDLIIRANERLAQEGCEIAIGPVDGDTWHRYRFVTERGNERPLFLEPENPECYPRDFSEAEFAPIAHYVSAEEVELHRADRRTERARLRFARRGITIRPFDRERYSEDLSAIYNVACKAFAANLLFSPISFEAFSELYNPLRSSIDPDFIRIAEHDGRPVAFAFGILDPQDQATLIGKTQARLPDTAYAGLGSVMLDDVRRVADERGVKRIIHALIRDDNIALNGSRKVATTIRGYSLFGRDLP